MTDVGLDSFDDMSFYLGIVEGFCSSRSVCDSDISATDNETDDYDDSDSWSERRCEQHTMTEETKKRIIDLGNISLWSTKRVQNRTGRNLFLRYDISDTESETDSDEDDCDELLVVSRYAYIGTSTECAELDLLEDLSLSRCPGDETDSSISGFELYIAFYSTALLTFLVLRTLPIEIRSCISQSILSE
jgi:hypothetical protein